MEIWEHSDHDPVRRLRKHILWTEIQSLQLFSGFSGSGKSTQLRRLQRDLETKGYLVVYANAEDARTCARIDRKNEPNLVRSVKSSVSAKPPLPRARSQFPEKT